MILLYLKKNEQQIPVRQEIVGLHSVYTGARTGELSRRSFSWTIASFGFKVKLLPCRSSAPLAGSRAGKHALCFNSTSWLLTWLLRKSRRQQHERFLTRGSSGCFTVFSYFSPLGLWMRLFVFRVHAGGSRSPSPRKEPEAAAVTNWEEPLRRAGRRPMTRLVNTLQRPTRWGLGSKMKSRRNCKIRYVTQ